MHFIIHFLTIAALCFGFFVFYTIPIKKEYAILIIFLLLGLAVGMSLHMWEDGIAYSTEGFINNCAYIKEYESFDMEEILCFVAKNKDSCRKG